MTSSQALIIGAAMLAAACSSEVIAASSTAQPTMKRPMAESTDSKGEREADIIGTGGDTIGTAMVQPGPNGMVIRIDAGEIPEGFHGVHLHQKGDCSDPGAGFKASGSHINIAGNEHGLLNADGYHVGADFPNLYAGPERVMGELFAGGLMLDQALDDDGFALIIHENEDDHRTQPIGGAGARLACAAFN
jgi:Cu-Zn family superoxide dismutase